MENLRAFMLATAVKDACEDESHFDYLPADVGTNSETASFIVDQGFFLRFVSEELRTKAVAVEAGRLPLPSPRLRLRLSLPRRLSPLRRPRRRPLFPLPSRTIITTKTRRRA